MSFFDWWQVLSLCLFVALSSWRTLVLRRKNVSVWVMARDENGKARNTIGIFFLGGLALWFGLILVLATGNGDLLPAVLARPLFDSSMLKWLAVILTAAAFLLNLLGLLALDDNWRVGVDKGSPGELVTHGIYSFSRNPIMVCTFLYALAIWLTYSNLLMLGIFATVAVSVPYQVRREERFLEARYGARYLEYQRRVGRYWTLPGGKRD